jgi:nickel transport protein
MKETKIVKELLFALFCFCLLTSSAYAHSIHYEVQQKGISVRVFYSEKDPASYSSYELFGPGDTLPHQTGRTDKNGFASFFPDRAGIWKIKIWGESSHGFHGVTIDVKVNEALQLQSFGRPLVATHTKLIVGISLIFGLFGIYALLRSRRSHDKKNKS